MIRILFILLSIIFYINTAIAQLADTTYSLTDTATAIDTDSTYEEDTTISYKYERRYLDEEKLNALLKQKRFQYKDWESDTLSYEDFFKRKNKELADSSFKGFNASVFLWVVLILFAIFIIMELAGMGPRQFFRKSKQILPDNLDQNEDIHAIDFEKQITIAIANNDYNLAIRLYYLQTLKFLNDSKQISWQPNKTNWQYYYEIKADLVKKHFQQATMLFEYAWYGKGYIRADSFDEYRNLFTQIQQFKP